MVGGCGIISSRWVAAIYLVWVAAVYIISVDCGGIVSWLQPRVASEGSCILLFFSVGSCGFFCLGGLLWHCLMAAASCCLGGWLWLSKRLRLGFCSLHFRL
jgi:hypothetical protein